MKNTIAEVMQFPCQAWLQYCDTVNADAFQCCKEYILTVDLLINNFDESLNQSTLVVTLHYKSEVDLKTRVFAQGSLKTFLLPHQPLVSTFKHPVHEEPNPSFFTYNLNSAHLQVLQQEKVFQTETSFSI